MKIKVLELFSGIGGMHYALKKVKEHYEEFEFSVFRAIDISDVANSVYKHNFPDVEVKGSNICGLTAKNLEKWGIEAIVMSPPCQPFTRQGNQKDLEDNRSQPFLHIVNEILPNVKCLNYILLENVKGFEKSQAHKVLIDKLSANGFKFKEFLICPKQIGIPNSRLRYYLIASKNETFEQGSELILNVENIDSDIVQKFVKSDKDLSSYLNDENDPFDHEALLIKDPVLEKYGEVFDIIQPESTGSCCFTKAYSKYAEGTGTSQNLFL